MKSIWGFLGAAVFLLMLPLAASYQMLLDNGVETFIHFILATGSLLIALAVFDFSKVAKWINWIACLAVSVEAVIFLLQGVSHLIQNNSLTYFSYQVLGQWIESGLVDLFILWCIAMLVAESRGKTRILGFVAVSMVFCFEIYKYWLSYFGDTPAESLKLLFLLLFLWLFLESKKILLQLQNDSESQPLPTN